MQCLAQRAGKNALADRTAVVGAGAQIIEGRGVGNGALGDTPRVYRGGQLAEQHLFGVREIATDNDVPIVESPPLARALFASVEIDDEIPVEHYQAVAEVIGYVMKLKRGFSRG